MLLYGTGKTTSTEMRRDMIDKVQKIRKEVVRLKSNLIHGACASQIAMETLCKEEAYDEVLTILDTLQEEPVSEDLNTAAKEYANNITDKLGYRLQLRRAVCFGAQWKEKNLWKPADGEDLPRYEREVVVFTQDFPNDAGMMRIAIAHRPNPNGWNGKSLTSGKVEHYTPKTYDKGGWNIPDVKWWLDCQIPKMGED